MVGALGDTFGSWESGYQGIQKDHCQSIDYASSTLSSLGGATGRPAVLSLPGQDIPESPEEQVIPSSGGLATHRPPGSCSSLWRLLPPYSG